MFHEILFQWKTIRSGKRNCRRLAVKGYLVIQDERSQYKCVSEIFVKSFSGATADCMNSHVCPTIKRDPGKIILHCGTNDLCSKAIPKDITEELADSGKSMKSKANEVIIYYIDNTITEPEYH